ncbi:MAG: hypothetical protein U1D69_14935 [Polynucleobacter sp.]|nr:hypothetical protein [Polynucleobacter sp.]
MNASPQKIQKPALPSSTTAEQQKQIAVLGAMRKRKPSFRLVQALLKNMEVESATGWDRLIEKFSQASIQSSDEMKDKTAKLCTIYESLVKHSKKGVFGVKIHNKPAFQATIDKITKLPKDEEFISTYPLPVDDETLLKKSLNPAIVKVDEDTHEVYISLCSKRIFKQKVELHRDDFEAEDKNPLDQYEEVFGIKTEVFQAYDHIKIDKRTGTILFFIDASRDPCTSDLYASYQYFNSIIQEPITDLKPNELEYINFYPKIATLYKSEEGHIVRFEHATPTGSLKSEKMRGKKSDLRNEKFHKGGMDAVNNYTNGCGIVKSFSAPSGIGEFSVSILGSFVAAGAPTASIQLARIENCANERDFNLALSKIL